MASKIIKAKPTSPGRRSRSWVSRHNLSKGSGHAPLLEKKIQKSGRNNQGRIQPVIEEEVIRSITE